MKREQLTIEQRNIVMIAGQLLGKYVRIQPSLAPRYYDNKISSFNTTIVGVNKLNCGNNGYKDVKGELHSYPSITGQNWAPVGIRTISHVYDDKEGTWETINEFFGMDIAKLKI